MLRDAVTEAGLDADAVAEEAAQRPAAQDAGHRAHRGGRPLGGVRRADLHRGRRGGVRAVHGARPGRRPRAGPRPAAVVAPQRVQAHPHPPLTGATRSGRVMSAQDRRSGQLGDEVGPLLGARIAPRRGARTGVCRSRTYRCSVGESSASSSNSSERANGGASASRSARATTATTRLRHRGHADTVAASRSPVRVNRLEASAASNATILTVGVEDHEVGAGHGRTVAPRRRGRAGTTVAACGPS